MQERIAEGQAKGASEAQVVAAVQGVEGLLEASQAAMIHAGRTQAQQGEIVAGAQAMERGASRGADRVADQARAGGSLAHGLVQRASQARGEGEPVDNAIAKIGAKLDAGASDDVVASLVGGDRTRARCSRNRRIRPRRETRARRPASPVP